MDSSGAKHWAIHFTCMISTHPGTLQDRYYTHTHPNFTESLNDLLFQDHIAHQMRKLKFKPTNFDDFQNPYFQPVSNIIYMHFNLEQKNHAD